MNLFRVLTQRKLASEGGEAPPRSVTLGDNEPLFGTPAEAEARFLPLVLQRELSRFAWRALAFALGLAGLFLMLALISYNAGDPSANMVTDAQAMNWLGQPGAWVADWAVQGLGMSAWILTLILLVWAGRLIHVFAAPHPLRRLLWVWVTVVLAAYVFAVALPGFRGGIVGHFLAQQLPTWWLPFLVLPFACFGFIWALSRALSISPKALGTKLQAPFITSSERLLTARQAQLERRRDSVGRAYLWTRLMRLIKRAPKTTVDPAQERSIPAFLRTGAVADNPENTASTPYIAQDEEVLCPAEAVAFQPQETGFVAAEPSIEEEIQWQTPPSAEPSALTVEGATIEPPHVSEEPAKTVTFVAPAAQRKPVHKAKTAAPATATYDPPPLDLLYTPTDQDRATAMTQIEADAMAAKLEETLRDYGVKGEITRVSPGPVVTLYELEPAPGTKTSRVVGLADDIARSMAALSARIAAVPGKSVIGIELPNPTRETVFFREMLEDASFSGSKAALPLALGKDIGGAAVMSDLAKMPHLLVAGTTGSGKSVAVNTMILSLVYALSPEQVRFIMIDPKILELSVYDDIPHLLSPVVTDPKKAVVALKWVVQEMNQRYHNMSDLNVRNIANFNAKIKTALEKGEALTRTVQVGFDPDSGEPVHEEQAFPMRPLPHIVVIVDEMAELMLMVGKDVEAAIQSIAQKARAAGIHMIMATQRPSVDVITGTIKANFPSRISFAVSSKIDSRTVLNEMGAEQLLGQGDMLFQPNGSRTMRVHGPFATDEEVEAVVEHLKTIGSPEYVEAIINEEALEAEAGPDGLDLPLFEKESSGDDLYDQAVQVVLKDKKASTSHVQRRLQIGYNRAANLIDRMEQEGLITPADHVGRRKIVVPGDSADV